MEALEGVLKCLLDHGMKLRLAKCKFFQTNVKYLGHRIDKNGVHPTGAAEHIFQKGALNTCSHATM